VRVAMLRAAALERFGDVKAAQQWLAQPHLALGSRAPEQAAAHIELLAQLTPMLQQQQARVQASSIGLIGLDKSFEHSIQPSDQPLDRVFSGDGRTAAAPPASA
jgi:hypothetical protein